jgi:1,4-dihydroxy-2-naphthoate octaprenyltransferase
LLIFAAFGLVVYGVGTGIFPIGGLLFLGGIPLAYSATRILMHEYQKRSLVRANTTTIQLHLLSGLLMTIGVLFSLQISRLLS